MLERTPGAHCNIMLTWLFEARRRSQKFLDRTLRNGVRSSGGGHVRMNLLCETREPTSASVSWKSPDNTSFTKAIRNEVLMETLATLRTSIVAVLPRL